MTVTNGYCSLADVKGRLDITDTENDLEIESVINAVSRWIDYNRGRRIYAATETRYYSTDATDRVIVDDLLSVTSLKTDSDGDGTFENTWTANTDYHLYPYNAAGDAMPYTQIRRAVYSNYTFPTLPKAIQITGSFGYASTTPPAIKEASILASMRVWKRRDMVFGTAGNADLGTIEAIVAMSNDGELMALLGAVPRRIV